MVGSYGEEAIRAAWLGCNTNNFNLNANNNLNNNNAARGIAHLQRGQLFSEVYLYKNSYLFSSSMGKHFLHLKQGWLCHPVFLSRCDSHILTQEMSHSFLANVVRKVLTTILAKQIQKFLK